MAAFFGRALVAGKTLYYDDLTFWFYPWKALLRHMAQQGHIALWLPWEFCGMPHQADIQRQLLYPPNAIFYLCDTGRAMVCFVAFHFVVAAWAMTAFLGACELPLAAAVCGGVVYAFSAFLVMHASQLPMLASYAWIPAWLWASARCWARASWRSVVAGSLAVALLLYGGAPQLAFMALLVDTLFVWLWCLERFERRERKAERWRALAGCALMPLGGALLAAAQLVPMAELVAWSPRAADLPLAWSSMGTLTPPMLATLLAPYALGNPHEGTWSGGYTFHEECCYVGLVPLVVMTAALVDWRKHGVRAWFALGLGLLGMALALGNYFVVFGHPLHDAICRVFPLYARFRVPARWNAVTMIAASYLAAMGVTTLSRYRPERERRSFEGWNPLLASLSTAGVMATWLYVNSGFGQLASEGGTGLVLLAVTAAVLLLLHTTSTRSVAGVVLLCGVLCVDLVVNFAGRYIVFQAPPQPLTTFPLLQTLREATASPHPQRVLSHTSIEVPTEFATWFPVYGIPNVQGSNPLFLRRYVDYLTYSQAGSLPSDDPMILQHNGFFVMYPIENDMTRMLDLRYEVTKEMQVRPAHEPFGMAWAAADYAVVPDRDRRLEQLRSTGFDPHARVLLNAAPAAPHTTGPVTCDADCILYEADRIFFNIKMSRAGYVVFSEIYYPGWEASIDGQGAEILCGDEIFRTVWVPQGTHRVEFRFQPRSLVIGLWVTCLTAALMGAYPLWRRRRRR